MKDFSQHAEDYNNILNDLDRLRQELAEAQNAVTVAEGKLQGRAGNLSRVRSELVKAVSDARPLRIFKLPKQGKVVVVQYGDDAVSIIVGDPE